ncbi:ABC transporter ATP-binding protein [Psychroserpens burtonensis]|uniref:ABC transporter ATP-binding protein n=1 Tax=Psychroserpens burtonensis TaxID=49278 RepID=A0A5C7BBM0_9FLAO|nr:Pycsar system effector family protein [Psychroserpens burtonensis]TXE20056.1 ABC transporter ATP-binding protein [Psychroserpens burtonensis]
MEEQNINKNKHTDDLIDHYWGTISYLTSLIKASELKAGLILSFYGILLNFIYQGTKNFSDTLSSDIFLFILLGLWAVCTVASIFFCVRCFIPRIEGKFSKNMFFFKDVISKFGDIKEFSKTFLAMSKDEEALFGQLGEQIFIISKIADWKFRNVKRAISFLAIGLIILFITGLYHIVYILT